MSMCYVHTTHRNVVIIRQYQTYLPHDQYDTLYSYGKRDYNFYY